MPLINPYKVSEIIKDVAAEFIIPRFRQLEPHEIQQKTGPTDLVTIADQEAENALEKYLRDILPGSLVVGEEAVSKKLSSISTLTAINDPIWVIDPVDGTNNFANGLPVYGCLLALVQKGQCVQGWLYDIPNNRFAITEKSSGVELNGTSITFKPLNSISLLSLNGYISLKYFNKQTIPPAKSIVSKSFGKTESLMCAAHEYINILSNSAAFSLYRRTKPWDHLAGALAINEAGGVAKKWDKNTYTPTDIDGGLINASSEAIWEDVHSLLQDILNSAAANNPAIAPK